MLLDLLVSVGLLQGETAVLWVRSNVCIVAFRLKKANEFRAIITRNALS